MVFLQREMDLPGYHIVGVRSIPRVRVWSLSLLLHSTVGERLPAGVLAVPYGLWGTVREADHIVFPVSDQICFNACVMRLEHLPIANMIAEFHAEDLVAFVVSEQSSVCPFFDISSAWKCSYA